MPLIVGKCPDVCKRKRNHTQISTLVPFSYPAVVFTTSAHTVNPTAGVLLPRKPPLRVGAGPSPLPSGRTATAALVRTGVTTFTVLHLCLVSGAESGDMYPRQDPAEHRQGGEGLWRRLFIFTSTRQGAPGWTLRMLQAPPLLLSSCFWCTRGRTVSQTLWMLSGTSQHWFGIHENIWIMFGKSQGQSTWFFAADQGGFLFLTTYMKGTSF